MARPSGPKNRAGGRWTEARFRSFVTSALRGSSRKWAPISDVLTEARVRRGTYLCANCKEEGPATIKIEGKRVKNAVVDHINPIVDPEVGFTTWDDFINRLFCEEENLQVLCHSCHKEKSNKERAVAAARRKKEKDNG